MRQNSPVRRGSPDGVASPTGSPASRVKPQSQGLSLRWRMILIIAGIPLLLVTPVMIFVGRQYQEAYREAFWSKGDLATVQLRQTIETISPFVDHVGDAPGLSAFLQDLVANVGDLDFIALVDGHGLVIEHSRPGYQGQVVREFQDLEAGATERGPSDDPYSVVLRDLPFGSTYLIWRSMSMPGNADERLYIVVGERASLVDPPVYPLVVAGLLVAGLLILLIPLALHRLVLQPLSVLAEGVAIVGRGDLAHRIAVDRDDEFGFVAQAFNQMAAQLRAVVNRLEQTVAERTAALERRNVQLEAVSLVGQQAAREHNVSALLDTAVNAISDRFGFYHTGLFILDDSKEWAILRAASSEGGQRMLNRGHRLRVGQVGIVGYVAASGKPRIAFDVGRDAVWFDNPDLPNTRSEMALPLIGEEEVLGVLDVQSEQESAFTSDDVSTLQLMADQLTVALTNARALEAMEVALAELRELQVDYARSGWARVTQRMRPLAYEYDRVATTPVPPLPVPPDLADGTVPHTIVMDGDVPVVMEGLRAGDQILGYLGLADSRRIWSDEELALIHSVGEQVALALDNARLFEDTQRNERQQYLISRVLQIASDPELDAGEVLAGIAGVLAQGLDLAVVIFTFPHPALPVAHAHAFVDPQGERLPLPSENVRLYPEHLTFFRGLVEPELGPMAPLLGGVEATRADGADELVDVHSRDADGARTAWSRYDFERVLYVPIARAGGGSAASESVPGGDSGPNGADERAPGGERPPQGFIGLLQDRDKPPLDPDTRELAENLASQIAVVLENLRLSEETEQRSEELRMLYRISLSLSELLEPDDVLREIVRQGATLLKADAANLWVHDPERGVLTLEFDYQDGAEGRLNYQTQRGQGLAGEALARQRTILVDDYAEWENRIPDLVSSRYHGMLAIPLLGRFGPLGVLVVLSEQPGFFGDREAGLADLFSAQAAAALENARLNQDAQRRAEEFSQLYEVGIDLITILDIEALLDRAADWARRVFSAERAVVFLREPGSGVYVRGQSASDVRYLPDQGEGQASGRRTEPGRGGLTERIIESRESVVIGDNREIALPSAQRLVQLGLLSQMGTPLRVGEEVLGALFVNGARVNQFSPRDVDMLEFLATQVSSAVQNSIQFAQTEEALAVVGRQARYQANISQAVALLNERGTGATDDVLRLLGEAAEVPVVLYLGAVVEPSGSGGGDEAYWRLKAHWSASDEAGTSGPLADYVRAGHLRHLAPSDMPQWTQALREQGYVMSGVADLVAGTVASELEAGMPVAQETGAVLGLAVSEEAPIPGFIATFREETTFWEEHEVMALQTVAAALSNTLARERLFDQVQQTLSETEALYRGSAALSQASSYHEILEVLLEHTVLGREVKTATLHLLDQLWVGDEQPGYTELVAYRGSESWTQVQRRRDLAEDPTLLRTLEQGAPVFVEDVRMRTESGGGEVVGFEHQADVGSPIVVPLVVGGQRIGYLRADYQTPRSFPESARRRLVSLAQQASIAVLNIRQLRASEARVRREQLIRQITSHIQEAPDVEGVLRTAVRELGRAFGTSRNRIQFVPPPDPAASDHVAATSDLGSDGQTDRTEVAPSTSGAQAGAVGRGTTEASSPGEEGDDQAG